ncbi:hypothetical protein VSDG_04285 [Cytospora chrysosperma]|uniref:Uncharacterized protein n=1 Tax=Cytospora chrysosperma TaxID=252740 RepID=A0A423W5F8_CYTCH|nr:hypothetical protein VSDG_04285 [Valsa sordida]
MEKNEDEDAGEDLESILKHGAEALFGENEKEQIKYDAAAIEKLLDRSQMATTQATDEEKSTKSQFAYARVWENKTGDLADDIQAEENPGLDISVWDKILKQREEEAKRLAELNKEVLGRGGRRRQAVKYNAQGNYGLEDQPAADVETRLDSDIDEDFVSNEDSESDNSQDGNVGSDASLHGQGKTKKGTARSRKTPQKKQASNKNTPQPTPSKQPTNRKPRTPRKPATPRKEPTPRTRATPRSTRNKSQGNGPAAAQEKTLTGEGSSAQPVTPQTPTKGKSKGKSRGKGMAQASADNQDSLLKAHHDHSSSSQSPLSPQAPETRAPEAQPSLTQLPGEEVLVPNNRNTPAITDNQPNSNSGLSRTTSPAPEATSGNSAHTANTANTPPSTEQ